MALLHGGRLNEAIRLFGGSRKHWLDLSTGINPNGYVPKSVHPSWYQRLPEADDGLLVSAQAYYGTSELLLVPGSQWAIQALPALRQKQHGVGRVCLPKTGYREHALAWEQAGFEIILYQSEPSEAQLNDCDVCVVINPNNPTGHCVERSVLNGWASALEKRGAWLVVDEAFIEVSEAASLVGDLASHNNLIVLRSLGKFFGLAGLRVGALIAHQDIRDALSPALGPWPLATVSREVAKQAMADAAWQQAAKTQCHKAACRLERMLCDAFVTEVSGTNLFKTLFHGQAQQIYTTLCQQQVLVRLLDDASGLRFGLPPNKETAWVQLEHALASARKTL